MTESVQRFAVWTATHDNGWTSDATENPDGTFAAWATNETGPIRPDYIEDGTENAKHAAEYALRQKTGHEHCSAPCSGWHLHTHVHALEQEE